LHMYYCPRRKGSYPVSMYSCPRLSGPYPLNMYHYPWRSGNSPRLSGTFLWRKGFYPVSEYSDLHFVPAVHRGTSAEMVILFIGTVAFQRMSRLQRAASVEPLEAIRPEQSPRPGPSSPLPGRRRPSPSSKKTAVSISTGRGPWHVDRPATRNRPSNENGPNMCHLSALRAIPRGPKE
jgi:hypothetical protein